MEVEGAGGRSGETPAPEAGGAAENPDRADNAPEPDHLPEPDHARPPEPDGVPGSVVGRAGAHAPGFLELIYGVLFDPARTFRRIAAAPPLGLTLVIVTLVNAAVGLMGVFTFRAVAPPGFTEWEAAVAALVPFLALINFFWWYFKWFGYGAVLHLTAQLFGGANGPAATLTVYGLAALPGLFMLPVEALVTGAGLGDTAASRLLGSAGLGVFIWGLVLLVIGLRAVHGLSARRAVAVVLLPAAAAAGLIILVVLTLGLGLSASLARTFVPF